MENQIQEIKMTKSLKLLITFRRCIIDSQCLKNQTEIFFIELLESEFNNHSIAIGQPRNIGFEHIYDRGIYEIEVNLECAPIQTYSELMSKIVQDWCNPKNSVSHLWLRLSNLAVLENSGKFCHSDVRIQEIAFGTFPDQQHFMQHKNYGSNPEEEIISTFLHSQQNFFVYTCFKHLETCYKKCPKLLHYKFQVYYQSLSYVAINFLPNCDRVEIFFHTEHCPFLYFWENKKAEEATTLLNYQEYEKNKWTWKRILNFGCTCKESHYTTKEIGRCLVFKVVIPQKLKAWDIIKRLMQKCPASTLFYFSNIKTIYCNREYEYIFEDFEQFPFDENLLQKIPNLASIEDYKFQCQFAWNAVISKSLEIRDQIMLKYTTESSSDHWTKLKELLKSYLMDDVVALVESLHDISKMHSKILMFSFEDALRKLYEYYHEDEEIETLPDGMCLVRRVIICPSRIIYISPTEHFKNRIIRNFCVENLIRVSIYDDDFQSLSYVRNSRKKDFISQVVRPHLSDGIQIGPRVYEFVASSCSQLRGHCVWMYAKDHAGHTAHSIRAWMGDFSSIKNVAKCMARMGQCFTTSEEAEGIKLNDDDILKIEDIKTEDGKYTFSDGVGMISKALAKKVRRQLAKKFYPEHVKKEDIYDPSAFQIRFKGCKGMVVESRNLEGIKIAIRDSMEKFPCTTSKALEIVKDSAPRPVFLNRQLITILENLGVSKQVFVDLQKKMVFNLTDSLLYERKARKRLESTSLDFPFKKLSDAGISLTQEPFFRSLLLCIYKLSVEKLKTKTRIEIPAEFGRNMMGVIDESRTLKENEIFAQYSEQVGRIMSPTKVLTGSVVISTNPCMQPGDVRKVTAVDVPELRHIKDCIVFPAVGSRPLQDQMAGSDLDGDEYTLIWYPSLIFPKDNVPAMDYTHNKEIRVEKDIQVEDMVDFFCNFIEKHDIGTMGNAHLAWADFHEKGAYSTVCMSIAKKYSEAVDFPKSGITCSLSEDEKPKCYPDFMEKGSKNNSYKSTKALGVLYRMIRNLEASVSAINCRLPVYPDQKFEFLGWERFKDVAKKRREQYSVRVKYILNKCGLQSESEIFTGCLGKVNDYSNNRYDTDKMVSLLKGYMVDTVNRYRLKFQKDCGKVNDVPSAKNVKYMMASAWYMVTYEDQDCTVLSFAWVVCDILCDIKKLNSGEKLKISERALFDNMDDNLLSLYHNNDHDSGIPGVCLCFSVMKWAVKKWMTESPFMLTEDSFRTQCYNSILEHYHRKRKCCSSIKDNCKCNVYCSPSKLILKFLKNYVEDASIFQSDEMNSDHSSTNIENAIFLENLQSMALKTYAALVITQNWRYLSLTETDNSDFYSDSIEEGDPIKIRVTEALQKTIEGNVDKMCRILEELTGVKEIKMEVEDGNAGGKDFFILIHSFGSQMQRSNLEELILDKNFTPFIKSKIESH